MSGYKCSGPRWSQSVGRVVPLETSSGGRKVPQRSRPQGKPSSEAIGVQVVGVAEDGYCRVVA